MHPLHPGWVKVGRTVNLARRLSQYQTGDPYRQYRYAFTKPVTDAGWAEGEAHQRLEDEGIPFRGEWFCASQSQVVAILNRIE